MRRIAIAGLLALLLLLVSACGDDSATTPDITTGASTVPLAEEDATTTSIVGTTTTTALGAGENLAELDANWSVWNAAALHSYVLTYTCDCGGEQDETEELQTTVVRGAGEADARASGGIPLSVDTAFTLLHIAYTGEGPGQINQHGKAAVVEVSYDPDLGYPVRATLTWPDDRISWEIAAITDLPADAPVPSVPLAYGYPDTESWLVSSHSTFALRQIEAAREQFEASGPRSYTLTYERTCYPGCSGVVDFEVSVTKGTIASSSIVGGELPEGSSLEALSIEGLFDLAEQGIADSPRYAMLGGFTLSLHENLGYPTALWLDRHRSGNDGFRVTSLIPT